MTIPEWLRATPLSNAEIAEHCGVDVSQPTRWRTGNVPQGVALMRLVELSGHQISVDDIPVRKRGQRGRPKRMRRRA
jgi:hypothetical protein